MRIYVAGPYTKGDVMLNIRAAIEAADALLAEGHHPYVPHLTGFWHVISPKEYETWLAYDIEWLVVCDGVLRLPGESIGADTETKYAEYKGIPVWHSLTEIPRQNLAFCMDDDS